MGDFRVMGGLKLYIVLICTMTVPALCTGTGKCPVYPTPHNYDVQKMSGIWFELERSFCPIELPTSCTSLNVTVNERGYMYITVHTINRWTGSPSSSHGLGIPSYNGSSAFRYKLNNRMPYVIARLLPGAGQYTVLYTDYEQVAVVWSCTSVTLAHADRMWVLARRRELQASTRAHVYSVLQQLRLDPDRLYLAKNANCPNIQ